MTEREVEFDQKEAQNLHADPEWWKDSYTYLYKQKIFFVEFPCLLHECKRQTELNVVWRAEELVEWSQENVEILKNPDNKWTCAIDFWYFCIIEGYIVEFSIDYKSATHLSTLLKESFRLGQEEDY